LKAKVNKRASLDRRLRAAILVWGVEFSVARQRNSRHDVTSPAGIFMSAAVYTANVLTSARMAAGMTSRARRPLYRHSAG